MAQEVSRCSLTSKDRVRSKDVTCGIDDGQSVTETGFYKNT